ncbi:MAG: type II toxin-antitoxin system VapB family antitoxin [Rubrivivax sp.]|nr:type II toxin-antitoxin system VapB family antitoxin [Rubrivivax sp.]
MKTTIDIADALFAEAKHAAEREGTTLKALVEQGLRQVLVAQGRERESFRLRRATFNGRGLQRELQEASWDRLRELAYEGHGT